MNNKSQKEALGEKNLTPLKKNFKNDKMCLKKRKKKREGNRQRKPSPQDTKKKSEGKKLKSTKPFPWPQK
jgi:hypothetical protein